MSRVWWRDGNCNTHEILLFFACISTFWVVCVLICVSGDTRKKGRSCGDTVTRRVSEGILERKRKVERTGADVKQRSATMLVIFPRVCHWSRRGMSKTRGQQIDENGGRGQKGKIIPADAEARGSKARNKGNDVVFYDC